MSCIPGSRQGSPSRAARAHLREARRVACGPLEVDKFRTHTENGGKLTHAQYIEALHAAAYYAASEEANKVRQVAPDERGMGGGGN